MLKKLALNVLALSALSLPASAQLWSGLLDPSRAIDWSAAGVKGGIPTNYTLCATINPGTSAASMNSTIAGCANNTYVLLTSGTYSLSQSIEIHRSNVLVVGAGPTHTQLNFTGAGAGGAFSGTFYISTVAATGATDCTANPTFSTCPGESNAADWTGGYSQGATTLTFANIGSAGIGVGDYLNLDQRNEVADNGGYMSNDNGGNGVFQESTTFQAMANNVPSGNTGRIIAGVTWAQNQMVQVTAITGAGCGGSPVTCTGAGPFTVTISPGLYENNWHTGNAAGSYMGYAGVGVWFTKTISHVGVQNLAIDNSGCPDDITCQSGIAFLNVDNPWVENVRVTNTRRNHIWCINCVHGEFRDNYIYGAKNASSQSYGMEAFGAFDSLIQNNIFQQVAGSIAFAGMAGNVISYNYSINETQAPSGFQQQDFVLHSDGTELTLLEGNDAVAVAGDQLHGTSGKVTILRNWLSGLGYNTCTYSGGTCTNFANYNNQPTFQTYPLDFLSYDRGINVIGNILGTPGYHTTGNGGVYQNIPTMADLTNDGVSAGQCNHSIYNLGFGQGECFNFASDGVLNDTVVSSALMRWGNYDVLNAAVRWNTTEAQPGSATNLAANMLANSGSHVLPNSFYLSSKPSWWNVVAGVQPPWPAAGPDVTSGPGPGGYAYINPAWNCFKNIMGGPTDGSGSPLSFDANACYGAATPPTFVSDIRVSPQQAIIHVHTPQAGNCTFVVSASSSLSPVVNDVNAALFSGSNSDARTGSIVSASGDRWFVVGDRYVDQGSDGVWYSRSLSPSTPYYGTATCGTDSPQSFSFVTGPMPLGITRSDARRFDSRGLGNYALETVNFSNPSQLYTDPETGFQYRYMTGPGLEPIEADTVTGNSSTTINAGVLAPEILTSTNWTNASNSLVVDGSFASYTASAQDILTVRLNSWCGPGAACNGNNWSSSLGSGGWMMGGIDSYQLALTCNGGGSTIQVDVAYTWNGVSQGSEFEPQTCPSSTGTVTYPASLNGSGLASWQDATYPFVPGLAIQTEEQKYTVNTSGTAVTIASGTTFSLDPRILTAGSKITINGTEYTFAAINSATTATLSTSAGTQSGVTAYTSNFGLLIRKHSATSGTLNVDGATVRMAMSSTWNNGGTGSQAQCSDLTSTDAQGHIGRFCILSGEIENNGSIFWVTNDLQVRYIGFGQMPASSIGVTADEYAAKTNGYATINMFDGSDPNSWWVSTTLNATGRTTLVKATYNPAGAGGCGQTANYQTLPIDPGYVGGNMLSCNITYTELTRPSLSKDIWSQLPSNLTSGKFGTSGPSLAFVQNGYAIMTSSNGQDTEAWYTAVNLSTGLVTGNWSTYMNSSSTTGIYPCRACVLHAPSSSDQLAGYFGTIFNSYMGGSETGGGPYNLTVTTALTATPQYTPSQCASTFPSMSSTVSWLLPYSSGCDEVTLGGSDNIPCDPTPSTWESSNMPACSWGSGTQWQAGAVMPGDWFQDSTVGFEYFTFGLKVTGTTWVIIRNVGGLPHGPEMDTGSGGGPGYLKTHSSSWTAALICNYQGTPPTAVTETNGSGIIWDRFSYGIGHLAYQSAGMLGATFFPDINLNGNAIRTGNFPSAANTVATARLFAGASFGPASGLGVGSYVQSHPGWAGGTSSFTDMSPMAPGIGGTFVLWPQTGVVGPVGGGSSTLYKIPAASALLPLAKRYLDQAAWAGMYNFEDISGASSIDGTTATNYNFCSIDYSGATCGQSGAGEAVGDVFLNIPQATIDGSAGGTFDYNRANSAPLGQEPLAVIQYFFDRVSGANVINDGKWERRITTAGARYNGQDTYSNAKLLMGSNILMFNCGSPNLQRLQDVCIGLQPSNPAATATPHNGYVTIPIPVAGNSGDTIRINFWYNELGGFATTRQEQAYSDGSGVNPFVWAGETQHYVACSAIHCTVDVPGITGRVLYYAVHHLNGGVETVDQTQALVVP